GRLRGSVRHPDHPSRTGRGCLRAARIDRLRVPRAHRRLDQDQPVRWNQAHAAQAVHGHPDMRLTLRALAVLLGYPSDELKANIAEIRSALTGEGSLGADMLERLEPLLHSYETDDLLELQADYSELFDRSRKLSLHLFEHVHGDNRERGQAMIDLGSQYARAGFFLDTTELPDFIPVFLEYCSCLLPDEAGEMLDQPAHVFAALAERLDERD